MGNKILIGVVVVILAAGGYWLATKNPSNEEPVTPTPSPAPAPTPAPTPTPTTDVKTGEVTINITAAGFNPSTVTIKKGTKVTFTNNDTKLRWPASAPHPTHTDYPEFDPKKGIAAGSSWSFTFDKTGPWGFHDHLFPSQFGKITVVE